MISVQIINFHLEIAYLTNNNYQNSYLFLFPVFIYQIKFDLVFTNMVLCIKYDSSLRE